MNADQMMNKSVGWWERFKATLRIDVLTEKLAQYKPALFEILLYGGIGFLIGFVARRFSGYIILFISFLVLLFLLYRFDLMVVVINWEKLNDFFGFKGIDVDDATIISAAWLWIQQNVVISVSLVIGFFLGLKFG